MIRIFAIALLFASASAAAPLQGIDTDRLLEALAQKETGARWDGRPGPVGELSRWQITPVVWAQHSREPFADAARVESKARAVALAHLEWLGGRLVAAHVAVTVERLATTWHFGASYARRRTSWGTEVSNLYGALAASFGTSLRKKSVTAANRSFSASASTGSSSAATSNSANIARKRAAAAWYSSFMASNETPPLLMASAPSRENFR